MNEVNSLENLLDNNDNFISPFSRYYFGKDFNNLDLDNNQDFGVTHLKIALLSKNCDEFNFFSSINYKFKIIGLSEHKISTENNSINSLQGYNFVYTPCATSHIGTGFFVHNELIYKIRDDLTLTFLDKI